MTMKKRLLLSLSNLSRELKRRKAYLVLAAYALVAWILLQVGEITFAPLGLPDWVMTGLVALVIFAIQDEIATGVARALLDILTPVKTMANTDVSAYEYYLPYLWLSKVGNHAD